MKIVKYAGFGMAILLSLGMINQATSYTSAQVTSNASVRIVSESKDALISVKVKENELEGNDNKEILIPFTIKNNMNRPITEISIIEPSNIHMEKEEVVIQAGDKRELKVKYTGDKPSFLKLRFKWNGGSATIKQSLNLNSSQVSEVLETEEEENEKSKLDEKKALGEENIMEDMIPIAKSKDEQENKEQKIDKVEKEIAEDKVARKVQEEQKDKEKSIKKEKPEQ